MAAASDSIATKLENAAVTRQDAIIYLNTVIRILEVIPWTKQAIGEADNYGQGYISETQLDWRVEFADFIYSRFGKPDAAMRAAMER